MRVLEVGLQEFGAKLRLTLTDMKNWQKILNDVQGKINQLPNSTADDAIADDPLAPIVIDESETNRHVEQYR